MIPFLYFYYYLSFSFVALSAKLLYDVLLARIQSLFIR
jgi:hypothetical protein